MDPDSTPCSSAWVTALPSRLLTRALTHRSGSADHNERLEFLGDAVLNLAVSACCTSASRAPTKATSRASAPTWCARTACTGGAALGLPEVLRLSDGELRGGGAQRPSILADALEAVIGAVFLDGGFEPAQPWCAPVRRGDRRHRGRQLEQGRQDRTAGMAAGAPPPVPAYRITPRAARPTRRPSRSNAPWPRWAWPSAARAARAAPPNRKPPAACSTPSRPATAPAARCVHDRHPPNRRHARPRSAAA
jgi:dsRNA-specific ribonuclease